LIETPSPAAGVVLAGIGMAQYSEQPSAHEIHTF
jgi:hypothetical protein